MAKETMSHVIDGQTYLITQLDPKTATRIAIRLLKTLGAPLGGALGSLEMKPGGFASPSEMNVKMDMLGKAVSSIFEGVHEDEMLDTIERLLSVVMHNGSEVKFEHPNFQGKQLHLFKVVMKSAEVNFSDFFDENSVVGGALRKGLNMIRGIRASNGQSGESSSGESQHSKKSKGTGA